MAISGATAFASNVMNNLPAALIARNVLASSYSQIGTILAALVDVDVGPMVTGSRATMLVLALARREGHDLPTSRFVTLGVWATAPDLCRYDAHSESQRRADSLRGEGRSDHLSVSSP